MEEATDISPVKAISTNMSRAMHIVSLKVIHLQEMLENEDLLQYKYISGELKTSEQLQLYREPKAAHFFVIPHFFSHEARKEQVGVYARWWKWFFFWINFRLLEIQSQCLRYMKKEKQGTSNASV